MLAKEITYEDFDGNKRTETFMFNLTKAELTQFNLSINGGLENKLRQIIAAQNIPEIMELFKYFIDKSYGIKSPDGKKFVKSEELLDDFRQTQAYSDLYMELATDADKAVAFINGIMPKDLRQEGPIDVNSLLPGGAK